MTKRRLTRIVLLSTTAIASMWIGGALIPLPEIADQVIQAMPPALIPVAAAAAGAAASAGAVAAGATLLTASIIGSLVSGLVGLGLNLLFAPKLTSGGQSRSRTREFDPHPPFRFAFGEFPQEGDVIFHHSSGRYYYMTILLNSVPSDDACIQWIEINDGLRATIAGLNGDEVDEFGETSNIYDMTKGANLTAVDDQNAFGANSTPELKFWCGTGEQTQPPQKWLDEIPDVIDATDTWKGSTVLHVWIDHGNAKQGARRWTHGKPPPIRVMGKWAKLYDPRKDPNSGVTQYAATSPTPSPAHDSDDRTTWEWSSNPALALLMLVRDEKALGLDEEMIPIQQYADAADDCEIEDGAVSTVSLFNETWSGTTVGVQETGTDAGSGNWTSNRGSVTVGTGTTGSLSGKPVAKVFSADTDGTLVESETGRMGVYIDLREEGRRGDVEYILSLSGGALASPGGDGKWGFKLYTANEGKRNGETIINGLTTAQQEASFLPPIADFDSYTVVYDPGIAALGSLDPDTTHSIEGDFVSFVFVGGEPSEDDIEFGEFTLSTISQAAKTRFRCDGLVVIEEREVSLLDPVLACMAGHLDTTDGLLGVRAGVWVAPTDSLTQPVGDEIEVNGARDAGYDTVRAKFVSRAREWEETDGPGYALRAGARVHPLHLPMVREPEQAARLEKIFALRSEPNRVVTAVWDGREMNRRLGDRVNFALPGFARAESSYVIISKTPNTREVEDGFEVSVGMTLVEDVAATYAWGSDDYTEEAAFTPPKATSPSLEAPTSVTISETSSGGTEALKIVVVISSDLDDTADELRIQIDSGSGFSAFQIVTVELGTTTYTEFLIPAIVDVEYTARARAESDLLGVSDWTVSSTLTITGLATAEFRLLEDGTFRLLEDGNRRLLE